MPGQLDGSSGSGDGLYYAWQYGGIHFVAMNSESPIDTALFSDEEIAWYTLAPLVLMYLMCAPYSCM